MRAAVIEVPGRPPAVSQRSDPARRADCAVVSVRAAPITPLDVLCATGTSYFGTPATPYVPGVQGVGVVVEAGTLPAGTRVWFPTSAGMVPGDGSMAESCVVPEADLVVPPDGVDDTLVAALGLSAVAAWMALTWRGSLRTGEQVLVLGGGGVVGQVAVQAARLLGARHVVAGCRSGDSRERARAAGADAVVDTAGGDVDELAGRFAQAADGGYDVIVDPVFGVPASAAARLLAPGGRLVNLGGSAGEEAVFDSSTLRSRSAAVLGYTNNALSGEQRRDALRTVLDHAAAGRLSVAYDTVPLEDVTVAWSRQAAGVAPRRIVVRL